LHDQISLGSVIALSPPCGQFTLIDGQKPLVLLGGGVGIAPVLAIAPASSTWSAGAPPNEHRSVFRWPKTIHGIHETSTARNRCG